MAELDLATLDIHTRQLYATRGYAWEEWDFLRAHAPVFWYDRPEIEPFWAITRHADVLEISRRSDIFINGRRPRLSSRHDEANEVLFRETDLARRGWDANEVPDFVFMDDPRHKHFRSVVARRFTPAAFAKLEPHFAELSRQFARELADELEESARSGEPIDFVRAFAQKLPLAAIGEMLGLPPGEWRRMKRLTNVMVGSAEPEYDRPGETRAERVARAATEMTDAMLDVVADRRQRGRTADLASQIVHARIEGAPLSEQQLQGYLFLILAAGNETTQNAISGGTHALLQNPAQRELLAARPELLDSAVEEILRWTSPVLQFARTATQDYELGGQKIRAGERVGLWYPAANRDPEVFANPYRFDITRTPNRHLTFGGYGAHFCLGANLARAELRAAFRALVPQLHTMETAGPPEHAANLHVPAISRLPVRAAA